MGDEERGQPKPFDQLPQLHLHGAAQLGVQGAERLVQKQHSRLQHQHPRHRDALLLTARKLGRIAIGEIGKRNRLQHLRHAGVDLAPGHAAHAQPIADIAGHGQMREKRVALEHHADRAAVDRQSADIAAVDLDGAFLGIPEPRNAAQERGLAATRGTQQGDNLAFGDIERAILQDRDRPEALGNRPDAQHRGGHVRFLTKNRPSPAS